MFKILEKYPYLTISLVVFLMLLPQLDVMHVTIMEARNFITAREMVNDGNWLLTTMNGEARYQKPPLPTWFSAISGVFFGINSVYALRLPGVLMVLFTGIFAYFFSLKLQLSKNQSLQNSLILVTSFYVFGIINEAPWDIFTHGFMLAGIYFLCSLFQQNENTWKNAVWAGVFTGFSIMSKGPVSLYALLLPFLIAYGIAFQYKNLKAKLFPLLVFLVISILIGGWWFIYVRLADPEAFVAIAAKEAGNWGSYNIKPFYYYWNFFTQSGIWAIPALVSLIYPYLKSKVSYKKTYKLTFWWTIISVILLSLIPEKKARYLVPVLIPLAINTGFYIHYLITRYAEIKNAKEKFPVMVNFGLIAILCLAIPFVLFFSLKNNLSQYIIPFVLTAVFSFSTGVLMLIFLLKKNIKTVFYLTILFMVGLLAFGLPLSEAFNKNKLYTSLHSLHEFEDTNQVKTYSVGEIAPEFLWQYNGFLKNIYQNNTLTIPNNTRFALLIMSEDVDTITTKLNKNYQLTLVETFNINFGAKSKDRLIRYLYLVSKK